MRFRTAAMHKICAEKAERQDPPWLLEPEFLAQIEPAHVGIGDDIVGPALH
jgi:isopenicillin N synthase-like dioxygenase